VKCLLALILGLGVASSTWALSLQELQVLIDTTPIGHTITVPPGDYQGNLTVRRPCDLQFQTGARLIHVPGSAGPTLRIQSSDVAIKGLTVEGTGEGYRSDHTAILVTGSRITLSRITIQDAWSGIWLDACSEVSINQLEVTGLPQFAFWERGEGLRITNGSLIRVSDFHIRSTADGIYSERSTRLEIRDGLVQDARYGVHGMFSALGTVSGLRTSLTVVGVMLMESSQWVIGNSSLTNGYRTGSAGVREIRTREVSVEGNEIARQASGIELIDVRAGTFLNNRITENGTAWTWGRDNTGTTIQNNVHRGNLLDFAGDEPSERVLMGPDSSQHGAMQPAPSRTPAEKITVEATELHVRPKFDHNEWDGWSGTDLDQDGIGDTPYRFDIKSAVRAATRPWSGIFLGSPWSQWSQGIPGGEVIDEHPKARPER